MQAKKNVAEFRNRAKKVREIAEDIYDWDEDNFVLRFVADCEEIVETTRPQHRVLAV